MSKTVIVSIHGILTGRSDEDTWQENFDSWLAYNKPRIDHEPFVYGWLGPINSWLAKTFDWISDTFKVPRWTRRTRIENFKKFLLWVIYEHGDDAHIHIMAHSFGTFIVTEALKELETKLTDYSVCSVNLIGGIISSKIETNGYARLLDNRTIGTFHNWSSYYDRVVRYMARWPFGHIGYWGIIRPKALEDRSRPLRKPYKKYRAFNNHREHRHNGYFTEGAIFYPEFLKNIKEAEKWEDTLRKKENGKRK